MPGRGRAGSGRYASGRRSTWASWPARSGARLRNAGIRSAVLVAVTGVFVAGAAVFVGPPLFERLSVTRLVARADLPSGTLDPWTAGRPVIFLVVGSDRRDGLPPAREAAFGDVAGERADALELVEKRSSGDLQVLGLPRDVRVAIPGHGVRKLSAAYEYGPAVLVAAVRRFTGLPVHHLVEIDFAGLVAAVNAVGGITLRFPFPARDTVTGFKVAAGYHHLDGWTALAFSRSRRYEEFRGGRWRQVAADDLGRIHRQQLVLSVLARAVRGVRNPLHLSSLLRGTSGNVAVDRSLSTGATLDLLRSASHGFSAVAVLPARSAKADSSRLSPFQPTHYGGVDYVVPAQPAAGRVLAAFREGTLLTAKGLGP